MALWLFKPPTIKERPGPYQQFHPDSLALRIATPRGVSVLETASSVYEELRYPNEDEIKAAVTAYIGGHEYIVDQTEHDKLVTAGYGSNLTPL